MFQIDTMSRTPVYEQIIEQTERMVRLGVLKPGDQMPSVRGLSIRLSINPNTIQKAYTELDRRGILVTVAGRGAFVREDIGTFILRYREETFEKIRTAAAELRKLGVPGAEVEAAVRRVYEDGKGVSA